MTDMTVSPEEHRMMVDHGIKIRSDDKFGYKKRCCREGCDALVEYQCYCSDNLEEAVNKSQERSDFYCTNNCWIEVNDGGAEEAVACAWEECGCDCDDDDAKTAMEKAFAMYGVDSCYSLPRGWLVTIKREHDDIFQSIMRCTMDAFLEWDPPETEETDACACEWDT